MDRKGTDWRKLVKSSWRPKRFKMVRKKGQVERMGRSRIHEKHKAAYCRGDGKDSERENWGIDWVIGDKNSKAWDLGKSQRGKLQAKGDSNRINRGSRGEERSGGARIHLI